jgi:hypothetical protein
MADEPKIIFSMIGVSKRIERKEILRNISLSFYYGATRNRTSPPARLCANASRKE